jgi:hypothetical protein
VGKGSISREEAIALRVGEVMLGTNTTATGFCVR